MLTQNSHRSTSEVKNEQSPKVELIAYESCPSIASGSDKKLEDLEEVKDDEILEEEIVDFNYSSLQGVKESRIDGTPAQEVEALDSDR